MDFSTLSLSRFSTLVQSCSVQLSLCRVDSVCNRQEQEEGSHVAITSAKLYLLVNSMLQLHVLL